MKPVTLINTKFILAGVISKGIRQDTKIEQLYFCEFFIIFKQISYPEICVENKVSVI
jgi:hypothetical protein